MGREDTASVTNGNQQQQSPKVTKKKKKVNEKYKGFELLLDEDEEEGEVPMPKGMQCCYRLGRAYPDGRAV